ncbi:Tyrosine-protein kinase jak2, partial [Halocaridina rubra]
MDDAGSVLQIRLVIDAYHKEQPGLRYCFASQKKGTWTHLCQLEELVFVSMRPQDMTVEVARETGVPCYFKFQALDVLESFVSCLSGYYRLIATWTFDLCRELPTPSLDYLRANKCHGPIGRVYAAKKLKEKGGGAIGVALLREASDKYSSYKLDVTVENAKEPVSHDIVMEGDKVLFKDKEVMYNSLGAMLKELLKGKEPSIKISRILPPSDYDDATPLLLCASRDKKTRNSNNSGPVVISMDHLTSSEIRINRGRYSDLVVAQWTTQENREVAVKRPKFSNDYQGEREFLRMLNRYCFVTCECIATILGLTLSPLSLVMEYFPLGPLDKYLQSHKTDMKEVELVEAATYLARALHYLNLENVQHLKIRCHNILVAAHTDQTFKVKLGDPGVMRPYTQQDMHWIPVEYHVQPPWALQDPTTDIWAFSTTLWQIFSFGIIPLAGADMEEVRHLYAAGRLLPRPDSCPEDLYK